MNNECFHRVCPNFAFWITTRPQKLSQTDLFFIETHWNYRPLLVWVYCIAHNGPTLWELVLQYCTMFKTLKTLFKIFRKFLSRHSKQFDWKVIYFKLKKYVSFGTCWNPKTKFCLVVFMVKMSLSIIKWLTMPLVLQELA